MRKCSSTRASTNRSPSCTSRSLATAREPLRSTTKTRRPGITTVQRTMKQLSTTRDSSRWSRRNVPRWPKVIKNSCCTESTVILGCPNLGKNPWPSSISSICSQGLQASLSSLKFQVKWIGPHQLVPSLCRRLSDFWKFGSNTEIYPTFKQFSNLVLKELTLKFGSKSSPNSLQESISKTMLSARPWLSWLRRSHSNSPRLSCTLCRCRRTQLQLTGSVLPNSFSISLKRPRRPWLTRQLPFPPKWIGQPSCCLKCGKRQSKKPVESISEGKTVKLCTITCSRSTGKWSESPTPWTKLLSSKDMLVIWKKLTAGWSCTCRLKELQTSTRPGTSTTQFSDVSLPSRRRSLSTSCVT